MMKYPQTWIQGFNKIITLTCIETVKWSGISLFITISHTFFLLGGGFLTFSQLKCDS